MKYFRSSFFVVFIVLTIACALLLWGSQWYMLQTHGTGFGIITSAVYAAVLIVLLSMIAVLTKTRLIPIGVAACVVFSLFFFVVDVYFIPVLLLCFTGLLFSMWRVRYEMTFLRIMSFVRMIGSGYSFFVYTLALLLAGQYYFMFISLPPEKVVPDVQTSPQAAQITSSAMRFVLPFMGQFSFFAQRKEFQELEEAFSAVPTPSQDVLSDPRRYIQTVYDSMQSPALSDQELNEVLERVFITEDGRVSPVLALSYATILFAATVALLLIFNPVVCFCGDLLFILLRKLGFVSVESRAGDVEYISDPIKE